MNRLLASAAQLSVAAMALGWTSSVQATIAEQTPRLVTFRLDDPTLAHLRLLDAFHDVAVEPSSGLRHYLSSRWARWRVEPWAALTWQPIVVETTPRDEESVENHPTVMTTPGLGGRPGVCDGNRCASQLLTPADHSLFGFEPEQVSDSPLEFPPGASPAWLDPWFTAPIYKTPAATFAHDGFDSLWSLPPSKPLYNWRCRRRAVALARYGGEVDRFPLVRCDGSVAAEAFDRLTLMARTPESRRPGELLPDEPDRDALHAR